MNSEEVKKFCNDAVEAMNAGERLYNEVKDVDFALALGTICAVIDKLAYRHNLSEKRVYQMIYDVHSKVVEKFGDWKERENDECSD